KEQTDQDLNRKSHHDQEKCHHDGILQQTHALIILGIVAAEQSVHDEPADDEVSANDDRSKDALPQIRSDPEKVGQVAVHFINEQTDKDLNRKSHHDQEKCHHDGILQQTHALIILGIVAAEQSVHDEPADDEVSANDDRSKDALPQIRSDPEKVGQVAVHFINEA